MVRNSELSQVSFFNVRSNCYLLTSFYVLLLLLEYESDAKGNVGFL